MRQRVAAIIAAFLLSSCASSSAPTPTPTHPLIGCEVSCPDGFSMRRQHLCRGGRRWFEDLPRIIGENVTRGADGAVTSALWIVCTGQWKPDGTCTQTEDVAKEDVELQSCSSLVQSIDASREPDQRGRHDGEPLPGSFPPTP